MAGKVSRSRSATAGGRFPPRGWISRVAESRTSGEAGRVVGFFELFSVLEWRDGSDLGRASGDALVDESAVQGLALLDHVVFLEEFLEGEISLSSTSCGSGSARVENKSDGSAEARGPSRQRPTGGARGPAGAVGDRPRWVLTRRQRRKTPRDASRVAIRVTATTPRRRPREGRVVRASGEMSKTIADGGVPRASRASRARQIAPRVRASRRAPRQGKSAPVPEISRTSYHARANGRLSGASRSGASRDRANRDCPQRPGARSRSRIPRRNPPERAIGNPRVSSRPSRSTAIFKPNRGSISFESQTQAARTHPSRLGAWFSHRRSPIFPYPRTYPWRR